MGCVGLDLGVCPAHAGVEASRLTRTARVRGLPRARGGRGGHFFAEPLAKTFAPRTPGV